MLFVPFGCLVVIRVSRIILSSLNRILPINRANDEPPTANDREYVVEVPEEAEPMSEESRI